MLKPSLKVSTATKLRVTGPRFDTRRGAGIFSPCHRV